MIKKNIKGGNQNIPHYIVWQSLIWARFAIISPFLISLISFSLYCAGFRSWELFFDTFIVMGVLTIIIWWFWVVYTIATIAYMIEKSSGRLKDVLIDIHEMREEIKSFDNMIRNNIDNSNVI